MSKKTFHIVNPAEAFISKPNSNIDTLVDRRSTEKATIIKLEIEKKETKSKKVNLLMKPSVYAMIKKIAEVNKISINEAIHHCIKIVYQH